METSTYEQQAIDFLQTTSTTLKITYKRHGSHFEGEKETRDIYRVLLKNTNGSYGFDFGQSINGFGKTPTAYDILACLTKYDPESFEDFCSEFGDEAYNDNYTGSNRTSRKLYNAVLKEWEGTSKLFDYEQLELLREIQ